MARACAPQGVPGSTSTITILIPRPNFTASDKDIASGAASCYSYSMETLKQPNDYGAAGARGRSGLNAASLLLCSVLAGCASSWRNPAPSTNSPPSSWSPIPSQTNNSVAGQPPSPAPPISDGVHPNQSITDLFRDAPPPESPNVPRPPSSYTPVGQPYSPPGQPTYGASQAVGTPPSSATASSPPPISDGVHPNQSITDLFRQ